MINEEQVKEKTPNINNSEVDGHTLDQSLKMQRYNS